MRDSSSHAAADDATSGGGAAGARPRVLVLNHFAVPRDQAGGTRHVELFGRLTGWDYLIVASDFNQVTGRPVAAESGLAVVHVPAYSANGGKRVLGWALYAWRALRVGLRQRPVDVVYGSSPHLLSPLAAWAIAAVRRVPFVLEVRDLWPQVLLDMGTLKASSPVYRVLAALERFLYARADAIVSMATGTTDALRARGIADDRIVYIPNGADPADFTPSAPRDALRAKYGFTRFTAIYTGAHGPANGLDLLLDAAADLQRRGAAVDVVLVGGGVDKTRLQERATADGIGSVRFFDPVPKSEIPDLLAAADVGLHVLADVELFRTAVSPNKLFDYQAAGLPVLTNCGGVIQTLVEESGCGLGVTPTGLADGLAALRAKTDDERTALGAAGRVWIEANQSRTAMAGRLGALLDRVRR